MRFTSTGRNFPSLLKESKARLERMEGEEREEYKTSLFSGVEGFL